MPPKKRIKPDPVKHTRRKSLLLNESNPKNHDSPLVQDGERSFRCQFCSKAFHRKEHLQRHERLHTKEKPFQCKSCPAGFARRDLLARHSRLNHASISTPSSMNEGGCAGMSDVQGPSLTGATLEGMDDTSPSGFRVRNPETPNDVIIGHSTGRTDAGNGFIPFSPSPVQLGASQRTSAMLPLHSPETTVDMPSYLSGNGFGDFDLFIDSISGTYDNGLASFCVNEPILPSPAPLFPGVGSRYQAQNDDTSTSASNQTLTSGPRLFDDFTSTLPSFEPSQITKGRNEPWKITQQDWDSILVEVQKFDTIIPQGFFLLSRHTMTRYINTYFAGFHRHLPLIHFPSFSVLRCPVELILAMATIGALSAFDRKNAIMLFRASLKISQERIRHRKKHRHDRIFDSGKTPSSQLLDKDPSSAAESQFDPLPLAQALLILMAMATWGNSEAIFDEAIDIQNILVNYMRAEKLLEAQSISGDSSWATWIREEGFRRTIGIIFCFFIFHTIVYDHPPPILNSELNIHLPSRENDWEAKTENEWQQARSKHEAEPLFQSAFALLFSTHSEYTQSHYSSLGGYMLILALIQHIYFLRTVAKRKPVGQQGLSPEDMTEIERALQKWQSEWNQDPEAYLGPGSPLGPISFNSTALLRMAYIRLNVDLGPWRALTTHIPHEIASSINRSPPLQINRRLTRAVLYSAHALSIPVKIGINIVAHNQAFSWSLQHSLCALECVFIMSKWLIGIQPHISEGTIDEDEARLYAYIVDMVTEAEAGGSIESPCSDLCSRVVRIWARILSGTAHWNVVPLIGKTLEAYAQILESPST